MQSIVEHILGLGLADKLLILAYILGLSCLFISRDSQKWGSLFFFYFLKFFVPNVLPFVGVETRNSNNHTPIDTFEWETTPTQTRKQVLTKTNFKRMDKMEKSGVITNVELAENTENKALRVEIETAQNTDLSSLADVENVTDFLLSNKQQTLFSTLINLPKGAKVEDIKKALTGKTANLVICTESIEALSNGKIKRVEYERASDGETRRTRTMSRTYLKGQKGVEDAFEMLQDELRNRLNEGDFKVISDEEKKEEKKEERKQNFDF